jgi:hypothetical protein
MNEEIGILKKHKGGRPKKEKREQTEAQKARNAKNAERFKQYHSKIGEMESEQIPEKKKRVTKKKSKEPTVEITKIAEQIEEPKASKPVIVEKFVEPIIVEKVEKPQKVKKQREPKPKVDIEAQINKLVEERLKALEKPVEQVKPVEEPKQEQPEPEPKPEPKQLQVHFDPHIDRIHRQSVKRKCRFVY